MSDIGNHPILQKLEQVQQKHKRQGFRSIDPKVLHKLREKKTIGLKIPPSDSGRPRIREWLDKNVMLPILGGNKKVLLQSTEQLEAEDIQLHKKYDFRSIDKVRT